jgi:group II intron reverse transcriptase/maturase
MRPLGIPTVLDKTLQLAIAKILGLLYEPLFLNISYGFRPNRNAHEALKAVNHMVMGKRVNWIIDADIKGFFDTVNHDWLMRALEERISDPSLLRIIARFLKAGVMNEGKIEKTDKGTPQGGIVSPILANIYLHYCLDLWFEVKEKQTLQGYAEMVRYADDFVIGVQHSADAQKLLEDLKQRLAKFGMELAKDKTRILEFGRFAEKNSRKQGKGKPETFDFLGFTHYCSRTKDGRFALKLTTSRKKQVASLKSQNQWLKSIRNCLPIMDIWKLLSLKLQGHYQYYGISGNFEGIQRYYEQTRKLVFKWTNRRSQKKSWNWPTFEEYILRHPLPKPRLTYAIYNTW